MKKDSIFVDLLTFGMLTTGDNARYVPLPTKEALNRLLGDKSIEQALNGGYICEDGSTIFATLKHVRIEECIQSSLQVLVAA